MTAVYLCECSHPKNRHQGGTYWCRVDDCGCLRYTPDFQAPVSLEQVLAELEASDPAVAEASARLDETTAEILAKAATMPDGDTSARLRRVEQERDEASEVAEQWCQRYADMKDERDAAQRESDRREETVARNVRERDQALDARDAVREQRDLARAELASARTELGGLRAANDQLRADYIAAADELVQLRGNLGVRRVAELELQLAGMERQLHAADPQGDVIARLTRYQCETCGSRYGINYTDHEHGPLTPVTVTIARQGAPS